MAIGTARYMMFNIRMMWLILKETSFFPRAAVLNGGISLDKKHGCTETLLFEIESGNTGL